MKKRSDILAELRDVTVKQVALTHHTEGVRKLFDAATMCQNGQLSDLYRQQLHDLLDQTLDCTCSVMVLTRQLIELQDM